MNNKIVIVGVLDVEGSTNIFMAKAFAKLGFDVIPINYRTLVSNFGKEVMERTITNVVEQQKPYLAIFCKTNGVSPKVIASCNRYTKTWYWWMDPIETVRALPETIELASCATHASATGLGVCKYIGSKADKNMFHIMEGIDTDYYFPVSSIEEYKADISFIGSITPERKKYIELLINNGYDVKAYGHGFGREVNGEEFSAVCNSSKIMLSINTENNIEEYFSDRVLRYGACGSFVAQMYSPRAERYFGHEEHLIYFKNEEDILKAVEVYLPLEDARRNIAKNLYERVTSVYTWDNTVNAILEATKDKQ